MPSKSHIIIPYHLRDHNIQSWRKSFFCPCKRGTTVFWGPKKPLFKLDLEWASLDSYPRWVKYMSTKSHAHTRYGTLRKSSISTREYAEIHIQRLFFDNKNSIWKILELKIRTVETCSSASSIHRNFYFWRILNSQFLVEFQSFVFRQIWAVLGSFGQNLLHDRAESLP
jgi:hypothetical protein